MCFLSSCSKDTGALPIVAIELREPNTNDFRIFTPDNVRLEVWQVRMLNPQLSSINNVLGCSSIFLICQ